jgi:hypothetical protein
MAILGGELAGAELNEEPYSATAIGELTLFFENGQSLTLLPIFDLSNDVYYELIYVDSEQYLVSERFTALLDEWRRVSGDR